MAQRRIQARNWDKHHFKLATTIVIYTDSVKLDKNPLSLHVKKKKMKIYRLWLVFLDNVPTKRPARMIQWETLIIYILSVRSCHLKPNFDGILSIVFTVNYCCVTLSMWLMPNQKFIDILNGCDRRGHHSK